MVHRFTIRFFFLKRLAKRHFFSYGHDILILIWFIDREGVVCLYDKGSAKYFLYESKHFCIRAVNVISIRKNYNPKIRWDGLRSAEKREAANRTKLFGASEFTELNDGLGWLQRNGELAK